MTLIKHKTFFIKKKTYLLFWQLSSIQLKVSLSWIIVVNALKILSEVAEECKKNGKRFMYEQQMSLVL